MSEQSTEPKRPLRLEWVQAKTLTPNPQNWRIHPDPQLAGLKEVIGDDEIGWAGALLFNERTGRLFDGHGRLKIVSPDDYVPVLIGSWSEEAEKKILLTLDPLAALAQADGNALAALVAQVPMEVPTLEGIDAELSRLLEQFPPDGDPQKTELKQLPTQPPPKMTWVLLAIPTVRFGEIAEKVEQLAAIDGVLCETTANNG